MHGGSDAGQFKVKFDESREQNAKLTIAPATITEVEAPKAEAGADGATEPEVPEKPETKKAMEEGAAGETEGETKEGADAE